MKDKAKESFVAGGTETILMADDEEMVLAAGQAILEKLGYTVLTARDGDEALQVYRDHQGRRMNETGRRFNCPQAIGPCGEQEKNYE